MKRCCFPQLVSTVPLCVPPSATGPFYFLTPYSLFICVPVSICAGFSCHLASFSQFSFVFVLLLSLTPFCGEMSLPLSIFTLLTLNFSSCFFLCTFHHVDVQKYETKIKLRSVATTFWLFLIFPPSADFTLVVQVSKSEHVLLHAYCSLYMWIPREFMFHFACFYSPKLCYVSTVWSAGLKVSNKSRGTFIHV